MKKVLNFSKRTIQSLMLVMIIYTVFRVASGGLFGNWQGIVAILRQSVVPCIIAWGICANMSLGIWDFSAGPIIMLTGIIAGHLTLATNAGILGLIVFSIIIAMIFNLLMCLLQYALAIPTMVLSLGVVLVLETLSVFIFNGDGVKMAAMREISVLSRSPYCFILMAAAFLFTYIGLNYTKFGYHIRTLGNNFDVARSIGVNPFRTKVKSYLFGGALIGLASAMNLAANMLIRPATNLESVGTIFSAMMGVILGTYLTKYCNLAVGIIIGTVAMKMLASGLLSVGLSSTFQNLATGALLLSFAAFSSNQGRIAEKREISRRAAEANARREQSEKEA